MNVNLYYTKSYIGDAIKSLGRHNHGISPCEDSSEKCPFLASALSYSELFHSQASVAFSTCFGIYCLARAALDYGRSSTTIEAENVSCKRKEVFP
jgi:hypothetical protein